MLERRRGEIPHADYKRASSWVEKDGGFSFEMAFLLRLLFSLLSIFLVGQALKHRVMWFDSQFIK